MGESYVVLGCDGYDEVFEGEFEEAGGVSSGFVDCFVEGFYGVCDLFVFLVWQVVFGGVGHGGFSVSVVFGGIFKASLWGGFIGGLLW